MGVSYRRVNKIQLKSILLLWIHGFLLVILSWLFVLIITTLGFNLLLLMNSLVALILLLLVYPFFLSYVNFFLSDKIWGLSVETTILKMWVWGMVLMLIFLTIGYGTSMIFGTYAQIINFAILPIIYGVVGNQVGAMNEK